MKGISSRNSTYLFPFESVPCRIHCDVAEKDAYLYYFTQMHPGRTLVFCNSIDCVRRLVNLFTLIRFALLLSELSSWAMFGFLFS